MHQDNTEEYLLSEERRIKLKTPSGSANKAPLQAPVEILLSSKPQQTSPSAFGAAVGGLNGDQNYKDLCYS